MSRPLAHLLATRTSVSPNDVTYLSFLVAVLAAFGYVFGQPWIGGILSQASSILDGVDGDLAKELGRMSEWGAYLDSMLDRYADAIIIASMSLYASLQGGQPLFVIISGLFAITGTLLVSYTRALSNYAGHAAFSGSFANYAGNRDVRLLAIAMGSMLGLVSETLLLLAVLTNLVVITRLVETAKKVHGN